MTMFAQAAASKNVKFAVSAMMFAGALLASSVASATTYNLGTIYPNVDPVSVSNVVAKGVFTDTIDFTVAADNVDSSANNLFLSVGTKKPVVTYNITGLSYTLYTSSGTQIGGTYTGDNTSYTTMLTAGSSYYFKVTGTAVGTSGGNYGFSLSAVPEPETYGMMLGGLGLIGFMAARRKAKQAA